MDVSDSLDPVSRDEVNVILTNENGEISGKSKVVSKKDGIYGVRFMFKSYRLKPTLKKALRIYNVIFFNFLNAPGQTNCDIILNYRTQALKSL